MVVISDSTPLIHLAKLNKLNLLLKLYGEILITPEVYREVVVEGLMLGKEDAKEVEKLIERGIKIVEHKRSPGKLAGRYRIHRGEAGSILLAKQVKVKLLLINERAGRIAAKAEGLKVKGTVGVVFDALNTGLINNKEAMDILKKLRDNPHIFWINPDVIEIAMKRVASLF